MRNEQLEAKSLTGESLRVEFVRQGDRYAHHLVAVDAEGYRAILLDSEEGSANETREPSPPLQSLSIEKLPDGRNVALLVGMAGRRHWSASIEPLPNATGFAFDIACRTPHEEPVLVSTYSVPAPSAATLFVAADESRVDVQSARYHLAISPSQDAFAAFFLGLPGEKRSFYVLAQPQQGHTVRWKYFVELLPSDH